MKPVNFCSDPKNRSCLCSIFVALSLVGSVYFVGSEWLKKDLLRLSPEFGLNTTRYIDTKKSELSPELGSNATQQLDSKKSELSPELDSNATRHLDSKKSELASLDVKNNDMRPSTHQLKCNEKCRPVGSEALPEGIVSTFSNLEMHPLWGPVSQDSKLKHSTGLLAIAVGIGQKRLVNEIVKKFLESDFAVMLFHYDGIVDGWHDLEWSNRVIHVSAGNQTKWWFAKRFLHPDIVAAYEYIFLWDEDLGVENFHPQRYISIIKEEGLEISQPALDPNKSAVYHPITARSWRSRVHRRFYKYKGSGRCDDNSTAPPCVGWVELMAPVFSRAAWRCTWYMIQNDLIHAWGLDLQLGYCAQGDRMAKVGVIDEEYIVHYGLPTLGSFSDKNKMNSSAYSSDSEALAADVYRINNRSAVRRRSYDEMKVFRSRWKKSVEEDECWTDPFEEMAKI